MKISKEEFKQRLQINLTIHFNELVDEMINEGDDCRHVADIVNRLLKMDIQEMVQTMFDERFELEYATEIMLSSAVDELGSTIDFNLGNWQS